MIGRVAHLLRIQPPVVDNRGLLWGSGATVPSDGTDGWQTGAIWQHTDGGTGTALYMNEGTVTSSAFVRVESPGGSLTLADLQDVADGFATRLLETGTYASATSKGVVLSATNQRPAAFLYDDGGAVLGAGNYRGVLSRIYLGSTQTGAVAIRAIRGQVKPADGLTLNLTASEFETICGVEGYMELAGATGRTVGANTRVAALSALMEINQSITLTTGGKVVGVLVQLCQTTAKTVGGVGSAGILVDRVNSAHATHQATWNNGLVLASGACATGIYVDACTTAGINIVGDQAIGILCDVDENWTDGLKMSVDTTKTLTEGIEMSGAGTITTGITISATAVTTGIAISAGSLTDGIKISGTTPADGVEVSSVCSGGAFHVSGASASGLLIAGSCTTAGINFTGANLNCIKSVFNVGAQLGQYVQGIKMEHTRSADIQPSTGGWWGAQIVLNAGTGYTALNKTAYVLHCIFKGDATDPSSSATCNVARFETQSNGKVEDLLFVSANAGSTVEGDVARFVAHAAPTRAILAVQNGTVGSTPMGICVDIDETMTTGIQFNTGAAITNLLQITAAANTSYFLLVDAEAGCVPNYASAGSAIANLKVKIGSTDGYIKIYDAA